MKCLIASYIMVAYCFIGCAMPRLIPKDEDVIDKILQSKSNQELVHIYDNTITSKWYCIAPFDDPLFNRSKRYYNDIFSNNEEKDRMNYRANEQLKTFIFGKDRTQSNIYRHVFFGNTKMIGNAILKHKKILEELSHKNITDSKYKDEGEWRKRMYDSYQYDLKIYEQYKAITDKYFLDYIEERIDKKRLITKQTFLLRDKKTFKIACEIYNYKLYADLYAKPSLLIHRYRSLDKICKKTHSSYSYDYSNIGICKFHNESKQNDENNQYTNTSN